MLLKLFWRPALFAGKIHIGKISYAGGRSGEPSVEYLSRSLSAWD